MLNLISKLSDGVKSITDYLVTLYTNEWLFRLLTYIAIIITILIPAVAFIRYLVRLAMKSKENLLSLHSISRDFTKISIKDNKGLVANLFKEIEGCPGVEGKSSFSWILASDGIMEGFSVSPGDIKNIHKEVGTTVIEQDLKRVLEKGEKSVCSISYIERNSYKDKSNYYVHNVYNFTKILTFEIIFPKDRPPKEINVLFLRGVPVYTEKRKPVIQKTNSGLFKATWSKRNVKPGTFKIVWDW